MAPPHDAASQQDRIWACVDPLVTCFCKDVKGGACQTLLTPTSPEVTGLS